MDAEHDRWYLHKVWRDGYDHAYFLGRDLFHESPCQCDLCKRAYRKGRKAGKRRKWYMFGPPAYLRWLASLTLCKAGLHKKVIVAVPAGEYDVDHIMVCEHCGKELDK